MCLSAQSKGAKEKIVTRIIVSRCEVDLKKICTEYKTTYGQSLQKTILVSELYNPPLAHYLYTVRLALSCSSSNLLSFLQEHTKGDYQKALLGLCGPEA